jgi:hypothetical protein
MRPSFKIDRTGHNGSADEEGQSHVDERTPLVGVPNGGSSSHNGRGFWGQVFLGKHTPGLDSPNPFVKWPVHVWNVLKITLLSSESLSPQDFGSEQDKRFYFSPCQSVLLLFIQTMSMYSYSSSRSVSLLACPSGAPRLSSPSTSWQSYLWLPSCPLLPRRSRLNWARLSAAC